MTLVKKLTIALNMFKSLNKCYTTKESTEFVTLRAEIIASGVDVVEFDTLMNTIFDK